MKRTFICLVILLIAAAPMDARTVELMLHPAKAPEPAQKYQLLPKADEQIDADAVPLYKKAVQSLPKDFKTDQIREWARAPLDKLLIQQVQATLEKFKPTLELIEQASNYRQCNWPAAEVGTTTEELREYRKLAFLLALQSRFQIAKGQYNQAIGTIKTSLVMARHLGETLTLVQGVVGVAVCALMLNQAEQLIQAPDAPNLYWALQSLPKPFIDLTKQMELEMPEIRNKVRLLMNRLDRHIAALQCIEAMRLYAASHNGKFPNQISDITEVPIPNDPVTQKPFAYSHTGSKAILEGPIPEGGTAKDAIRYELNLKE